jgi:hypothetical protein
MRRGSLPKENLIISCYLDTHRLEQTFKKTDNKRRNRQKDFALLFTEAS